MSGHPISPNTTYQELTGRELALNGAVGRARKVVVNGRDYLVAPMTLIVPGVLAGSMGPLYYPPEEIARDYQAWNGMPLVRLHPTRNGSPVSGRQPDVMGTEEMGRVYNARIGTGGRLQAEAWFDVEATRRVDPSILERLAKGDPIELSTGLFTVNTPERGVHNGRPYVAVARDYRPDHLAVLPDRTGACSLRDGCGILINEAAMPTAADPVVNIFCPTGQGGGINPTCSPKGVRAGPDKGAGGGAGAGQSKPRLVEKTLGEALAPGNPHIAYVVYKGKRYSATRSFNDPSKIEMTTGHKISPPPKATGTYKGSYMRYTTITRPASTKVLHDESDTPVGNEAAEEVDLTPVVGYQPTGDPYLDAVVNCMAPKHPGPCKGWKRGVGATGAASSGAGATTGSGAKPKHPGTGGWTGMSPQRSTTPPPSKPAPAPKPTPPAPKPVPPPPKQVKPAAKKVTKATPPPEPTGHPAIDRARQAATTPAERLKAVYDNAAKYALITTAGRADGAGMSRKHVKEVLDAAKPAEMKGLADALGFRVKPGTSAKKLRKEIEDRIDSRVGASIRSRMLEGPQAESVRANLELSQQGYQTPRAVANEADMNDADLLDAVTNAFCPTGKGGGIKTDCSPKGGAARGGRGGSGVRTGSISTKGTRTSTAKVQTGATGAPKSSPTAKAGGAKVGAAFTSKGEGTRSKGVASKASAAPARKAGEAAAPAKKPARQVKVSRSEMKAAKKLDAARKAALAKGDQETAAKATAKLKRIVERADARAAGSTKVGKGAVGRKLEAKAKEAAMKQAEDKRLAKERKARAKGYKDSNARRKDLIEKREMARVKRADAKANPKKNALAEKDKVAKEQGYKDYKDKNAKGRGFKDAEDRRKHAITVREQARVARADRKAAAKAAATKAEATKSEVDKVGRDVRSRGRESKAAAKYVKAGVEAAAKGDQKKLSKVVEKVRKLKERAEKRAARNEETPHELYSFIANELGFVSAADRLKRLAEDTFDLLDYHLVGNVLFTAPNRLAAELHKLVQVANEAQITVNHVQGRAEYEWLLGPVVNRGGRPIEYDGRPIAPTAAERSRLARNAKKRGRDPQFAACIAACNKARGDDMPAPEESGSVGGDRIAVKNDYPAAVANLFGPAPAPTAPVAKNVIGGCGCGAAANSDLTTNCGNDGMCGPCAAKKAAAGKAMEVRVQNARRCSYCGTMVKDGEGVCPKCGMVMGMAGDGPKTNPAEPYKLLENANPDQARGYRGQWENNDKAAIYHAVRRAFGGNDPAPIPAMSDTPGQAAPTSDPGQDAEAEAAHSVSNMLARVYNSLKKRMGMGGKDEDGDEKGEKHRARTGCGY